MLDWPKWFCEGFELSHSVKASITTTSVGDTEFTKFATFLFKSELHRVTWKSVITERIKTVFNGYCVGASPSLCWVICRIMSWKVDKILISTLRFYFLHFFLYFYLFSEKKNWFKISIFPKDAFFHNSHCSNNCNI